MHVLMPMNVHRLDAFSGKRLGRRPHGRVVLGVPGREQGDLLRLGQAIEVGDFGEACGWRFFEQAVKAGCDALASDIKARTRGRRDRDGFEPFDSADKLAPIGEALFHALPRTARRGDQLEPVVALNRRQMLVGGDLAIADDRDSDAFHDLRPATYARAFWSVSSGDWPC